MTRPCSIGRLSRKSGAPRSVVGLFRGQRAALNLPPSTGTTSWLSFVKPPSPPAQAPIPPGLLVGIRALKLRLAGQRQELGEPDLRGCRAGVLAAICIFGYP